MQSFSIKTLFLGLLALGAPFAAVYAQTDGPADSDPARQTVEELQSALVAAMQMEGQTRYAERYRELAPVVCDAYALDVIARLILGTAWGDLSPEQQKRFTERFRHLATANFAANFKSYSGQHFQVTGVQELKRGQRLVESELVQPEGDTVSFRYVLADIAGQWHIINTIADGVSDLAIKRAEYSSLLRDQGFDALIAALDAKIEGLGGIPSNAGERTADG
ncbi:MAG: ABC transporter substrate-binding protein [Opitutales bacterium]